jgi:hypothetical protein
MFPEDEPKVPKTCPEGLLVPHETPMLPGSDSVALCEQLRITTEAEALNESARASGVFTPITIIATAMAVQKWRMRIMDTLFFVRFTGERALLVVGKFFCGRNVRVQTRNLPSSD